MAENDGGSSSSSTTTSSSSTDSGLLFGTNKKGERTIQPRPYKFLSSLDDPDPTNGIGFNTKNNRYEQVTVKSAGIGSGDPYVRSRMRNKFTNGELRTMRALGVNGATIREDILKIIWKEMVARNPGIIAAHGYTNLFPRGKKTMNPEQWEAAKLQCKANAEKFTEWKNKIVSGMNNYITKFCFGSSLKNKEKQDFIDLANSEDATVAAKVRGKYMSRISRWWSYNRRDIINAIISEFSTSQERTKQVLKKYESYGEKEGTGWFNVPDPA